MQYIPGYVGRKRLVLNCSLKY